MESMIKVTVGNNTSRETVIVPASTTLTKLFEDAKINTASTSISIDGAPYMGAMSATLENLNVGSECYIIAVTKTNNA